LENFSLSVIEELGVERHLGCGRQTGEQVEVSNRGARKGLGARRKTRESHHRSEHAIG
jgi:hypothetical protein